MSIEALCIQWDNVGFALSRKPFLYKTCHFDSCPPHFKQVGKGVALSGELPHPHD